MIIPCLTAMMGCSIDKCLFQQILQLTNIQHAMQFVGDRENSLEIWRTPILSSLLRLALGKVRPAYCQQNPTDLMGKRPNASMDFYDSYAFQNELPTNLSQPLSTQETTLQDIENTRVNVKFLMKILSQDPLQCEQLERNLSLTEY
jgi:hypothetical protein